MKNISKKLLSQTGETLIESLASVLIFTLASLMFFTMVSTSSTNNRKVDEIQRRYDSELSYAENRMNANTRAEAVITIINEDDSDENGQSTTKEVWIARKEDGAMTAYYITSAEGGEAD